MTSKVLELILKGKDETSGILSGVGDSVSNLGATVGKLAIGAIAGTTAAVVGLGAAATKLAVDAAPIEGIGAAFRATADDADAMLAAFKAGSAGALTNREAMASYNEAVQLVGKSFADDLPDAMGFLTKVASSTGKDMGYMMDSLVTGVGRLSPMILDNLGIQVDLTKANEEYADSLGITVKEMTKAQEQEAAMAQVMKLLERNTAKLPDVTGNLTTTMASLKATFADVKDECGLALVPALKSVGGLFTELGSEHGPMVMDVLSNITGTIVDLVAKFVDLVSGAGELDLASVIPPEVMGIFEAFQGVLGTLKDWWAEHGPAITDTATEMFGLIKESASDLAANVLPWITEKIELFGVWFEENGPLISEFAIVVMNAFTRIWQEVVAAWDVISPILDFMIEGILALVTFIMAVATGDWTAAWQAMEDIVWLAVNKVQEFFTNLADWVTGWFGSSWAGVMEQWTTNWELFEVIVTTVWNNITSAIETAVGKIKGWVQGVMDKFAAVKIPEWLKGKSPPPLANWITDIGLAMDDTAGVKALKFNRQMDGLHAPGLLPTTAAVAKQAGGVTIINHYGYGAIRSDRDITKLARQQRKSLRLHGAN